MLVILFLVLLTLVVFHRTLSYDWIIDDFQYIARCGCKFPTFNKEGVCTKCGYKEISKVSRIKAFWRAFLGTESNSPKMCHLMILVQHIINCSLIYVAFGRNLVSAIIATIFCIHPIAMQSSCFISAQGYSRSLIIALASLWLPLLAPLFFASGFWLSPVSPAYLPIPGLFIHSNWYVVIAIGIVLLTFYKKLSPSMEMHGRGKLTRQLRPILEPANIILFFKSMGYNFMLCLIPFRLGPMHTYLGRWGLTKEERKEMLKFDLYIPLGIVITIASLYGIITNTMFGLVWFFIFMLPWSNIITVQQQIAERYCLVALPGLIAFVVELVMKIPNQAVQVSLISVMFTYYFTRTIFHLEYHKDLLSCIEYSVLNFPDSFQAWTWKGGVELKLGLVSRAFESFLRAHDLRPYDFRVNNNLAAMMIDQYRFDEAEEFIKKAENSPDLFLNPKVKDQRIAALRIELREKKLKANKYDVGRNELCPCGSGNKYKKCCGR